MILDRSGCRANGEAVGETEWTNGVKALLMTSSHGGDQMH